MNVNRNRSDKGFSLVELLAVVLILAVLAAVAVPLYLNTRKSSAARACKANINAIASLEAAYALRNGKYADMPTLISTGPESLSSEAKCPLDNKPYNFDAAQGGNAKDAVLDGSATFYIDCPNAVTHLGDLGGAGNGAIDVKDWQRPMNKVTTETTP